MVISRKFGLKYIIILTVIIFASSFSLSSVAESSSDKVQRVDLVWAASDGLRHELYVATQRGGNWSAPQKITDDNADNLHPCLDSAADGKKWLFWTAIEQGESEIHYAVDDNGEWSEPQVLTTDLSSNMAPTVIVDDVGVPWVVWAGNDGVSNDEIYYSRFIDGKWQTPQQVNQANDVPDVLPVIEIDEQGNHLVSWDGFRKGNYVRLQSAWTGKSWEPEQVVDPELQKVMEKDMSIDKQVDFPDFVEDTRQAFFRVYPDN